MEIRQGLTYVKYFSQLIGLASNAVPENKVNDTNWEPGKTRNNLAGKVLQVFFVATDGSVFVPLGFLKWILTIISRESPKPSR